MQLLASSCLSIHPSVYFSTWNNSAPTGRNLMKFDICAFFECPSRTFKFHSNLTRITVTLREDLFSFVTISPLITLRNNLDKSRRENQNVCVVTFFFENHTVYKNMSKNMVEPERPKTIWRMRSACWISKATRAKIHSRSRAPILTPTRTRAHKQRNI